MAYEPELEKLERRYQDDPARNFAQLAERYRKDGRLEDALTLLRGHLAERPNYVSGLVVLGRCLLDQQADGEARETFERVLAVDAEHIIALRALGEIAERAGDRDGAQSWFTRLLDVDPMNEEAQAALERIATMEAAPPEAAAPAAEPVETAAPAAPVASVETVEPIASAAPAEEEVPETRTAEFTGHEEVPGFEATIQTDHAQPETVPESAEDVAEPVAPQDPHTAPFWAAGEVAEPVGEQLVEEPSAGEAMVEKAADDALMAEEAAPDIGEQPAEPVEAAGWHVEKATDDFLPRVSQPPPLDIEQYPDIEISSQLPEDAPLIGGGAGPEEEEPYQFPTGEPEVDLGFTEPAAEAEAVAETQEAAETEPTAEAAAPEEERAGEELAVEPFDSSLGWGAGERVSRQITQDDIAEAEHAQQEGLDQVFQRLPGLESAEPASEEDVSAAETVEGLQAYEPPAEAIQPIEGLEPTHAEASAAEELTEAVEPAGTAEPSGIAETEGFYVPPEAEPAAVEAGEEEDEARSTVERQAAPEGLPDMGQPEEPETPLVLEAEPEPVVTETMAELYARQGLVNEAREVYQQLLAQRPGDPALTEKLADLEREMAGAHGRRTGTFSAIATGGQSARAFLGAILAAQPAVMVAPAPAPEPAPAPPEAPAPEPAESASEATVEVAAVEVAEPSEPGPMDEAFGDEDAESEAEGAPTQPAEDEVSLSSVFGDDTPTPTTAPSPAPEPPQAPKDRAPGGFSFDEFFGKAASEGAETPRRDSITDDEGDEAFKDWLKGLRT